MFCKNCGREIDQKTLKKLMEQKDGSVVCSKCKQPLDNAEMCGGFWGLIAASEEKEAAEAETVNMTVMLDENGKPVQMNPRMQNRSSSSIPDANLRMPENNYSSQNSHQTSGAGMSDSAPYEQKAPEMRIRRSSARKDTELWITRAIAVLLGIALIISLITRCGKSDQPKDEMTKTTEISDVPDNNSDAAVTPSDVSENSQGALDEEPPSDSKFEKKDSPAESSTGTTEHSSVESPSGAAATTGSNSEKISEAANNETSTQNSASQKSGYRSVTRTIIVGEKEYNIESAISSDDGTISLKRQIKETGQPISEISAIYDETVQEENSSGTTEYTYQNGFLQMKRDDKNGVIEYIREPSQAKVVTERYSKNQTLREPTGRESKYRSVKKTYNDNGLYLDEIEYYRDKKSETDPFLKIKYDVEQHTEDTDGDGYNETSIKSEKYLLDDGTPVTMYEEENYEYDEILYTYKKQADQQYLRLSEMAYYLAGEPATGPNGFSYFTCEYLDESTRIDKFYGKDGKQVNVSAADPFLSSAVIPALYSYEYPYLTGIPNPDTGSAGEVGENAAAGPGLPTENQAGTQQRDPNSQSNYRQERSEPPSDYFDDETYYGPNYDDEDY